MSPIKSWFSPTAVLVTLVASASLSLHAKPHLPLPPLPEGQLAAWRFNDLSAYGPDNRWGDYSYTSLDPTDGSTFWTVHEYAESPGDVTYWGTWIGQIKPVP